MTDHIIYSTKTNKVVSFEIRGLRLFRGEHLVRRRIEVILAFLEQKGFYKKDEGSAGAAGLERVDLTRKRPETLDDAVQREGRWLLR